MLRFAAAASSDLSFTYYAAGTSNPVKRYLPSDSTGIQVREVRAMKIQVTLTRTDTGATTKIRSDSGELSKEYSSWDDALIDAEHIGLISKLEATAAKALPPGFPLHTSPELELSVLGNQSFVPGKTPPAR
jgi:hypothetical protein